MVLKVPRFNFKKEDINTKKIVELLEKYPQVSIKIECEDIEKYIEKIIDISFRVGSFEKEVKSKGKKLEEEIKKFLEKKVDINKVKECFDMPDDVLYSIYRYKPLVYLGSKEILKVEGDYYPPIYTEQKRSEEKFINASDYIYENLDIYFDLEDEMPNIKKQDKNVYILDALEFIAPLYFDSYLEEGDLKIIYKMLGLGPFLSYLNFKVIDFEKLKLVEKLEVYFQILKILKRINEKKAIRIEEKIKKVLF